MKNDTPTITDAMRQRCKQLLFGPGRHEWYYEKDPSNWRNVGLNSLNARGSMSLGAPTIPMADSMAKAGLIKWEQRTRAASKWIESDIERPEWVAVLTEHGRAVAEAKQVPTKAQRLWLVAIEAGAVNRSGHSWVNAMHRRGGVPGAGMCPTQSNYVMTCSLHDAGWITDAPEQPGGPFADRYRLALTDAGRLALTL